MHNNAMQKSFAQARLSTTISRSGLTDAELATVLGVNQSTVSRLKHGRISKVTKHQRKLDEYLGRAATGQIGGLSELMAIAESSPALRETLAALYRLMRENA